MFTHLILRRNVMEYLKTIEGELKIIQKANIEDVTLELKVLRKLSFDLLALKKVDFWESIEAYKDTAMHLKCEEIYKSEFRNKLLLRAFIYARDKI